MRRLIAEVHAAMFDAEPGQPSNTDRNHRRDDSERKGVIVSVRLRDPGLQRCVTRRE